MHIVLISQCEKAAILRTARVLDAYAQRHGDRTWMTRITLEGLVELRAELRASATRQTAISCYVNEGARRLRLLWTIGRRDAFARQGQVSVNSRRSKSIKEAVFPTSWKVAQRLARLAGWMHDLGKFGKIFQDKLQSPVPKADPVRHEWISLQVLMHIREGRSWEEAWSAPLLRMPDLMKHPMGPAKGIQSATACLAFLIMTHHRLPMGQAMTIGSKTTHNPSMPGDDQYITSNPQFLPPVAVPERQLWKAILNDLKEIEGMGSFGPEAWRAIATVARMGLILADHSVSSEDVHVRKGHGASLVKKGGGAFANTVRLPGGKRSLNQELGWHLRNVGDRAFVFVREIWKFHGPALSPKVIEGLMKPASNPRYAWQDRSAQALLTAQKEKRLPTLVMNVAGTGSGKTRMNVRCVAALREGEPVRITTALNLRTLTLQTRDAYAEQLGMAPSDLACVLGSTLAKQLHEAAKSGTLSSGPSSAKASTAPVRDDDENPFEDEFSCVGDVIEPPDWLKEFLARKPMLKPLIMSPVAVCTIDFLVAAGEPNLQGNHALAMMRMADSDLVLDEIDAYDPKAFVAVLRLVTAAAFWGRHVIASSATLPRPVARALYDAYALGSRMREAMSGEGAWRQVVIDDLVEARVVQAVGAEEFLSQFEERVKQSMAALGHRSFRKSELQPVKLEGTGKTDMFFKAIKEASLRMHDRHAYSVKAHGFDGRISFGLVRVANIRPAIRAANHLCNVIADARVCCYHAQLGGMARFHVERYLDAILTRKDGGWLDRVVETLPVKEAMERAGREGKERILFIVVATPVEEVGRDHDFDWGVVEPSSTQSIVQTAGRINRHRLEQVSEPNVAILQYNHRYVEAYKTDLPVARAVFCRPGLESADTRYPSRDLQELIDWPAVMEAGQIDARVRYQTEKHMLARFDDLSLEREVNNLLDRFLGCDSPMWLMANTYLDAPLRGKEGSQHEEWSQDKLSQYHRKEPDGRDFKFKLRNDKVKKVSATDNAWLSLTLKEQSALAQAVGISDPMKLMDALAVQVLSFGEQTELVHHLSFGFYSRDPSRA